MEEARVIALVRAGEVDAFAEIIEQYQAPIVRYLYRLTGNYEMAKAVSYTHLTLPTKRIV